jgi:hypothetical protein
MTGQLGAPLVVALVVATTAIAAPAHAATSRPAAGDWEGRGASLRVVGGKRHARVVDIAVKAPLCNFFAKPVGHGRSAQGPLAAKVRHGRFLARKPGIVAMVGFFTSRRRLRLTVSSDQPGCSDTTSIRLGPGRRVAPADGVSEGTASDGEPVYFDVAAGGRMLVHRPGTAYAIPKYTELVGIGTMTCDDSFMACGPAGPCAGGVQGGNQLIPRSGRTHVVVRSTEKDTDENGNTTVHTFVDDLHLDFTGRRTSTGSLTTDQPDRFGQAIHDDPPPPTPCTVTFTAAPLG